MKVLLLIGGMLGFSIGLLFSWAEDGSSSTCLWHACLAAYATAVLMRWWGDSWRRNLADSLRERQAKAPPPQPFSFPKASKS
jgi:hypothetical protein